jgi:metacaspase-1
MVILTDDQPNAISQPTRENIVRAMKWLVKDAQPHDSLFFHYSGHGGQTVDFNFQHLNGYHDTIFPLDWKKTGQIISEVILVIRQWLMLGNAYAHGGTFAGRLPYDGCI